MISDSDSLPVVSQAPMGFWDFQTVNPTRAFVLMAVGASLGLGIAAFGLFTARGTSTLIVPADAVAMVNQQPISRLDYNSELFTLYGTDVAQASAEQKQTVLQDLIRQELYVQRAKEIDVASFDPEVRAAMVSAVEQQIASDALTARPNDKALRAFYSEHRETYANEGLLTAVDLIFPPSSSPENIRGALMQDGPLATVLARLKGSDTRRLNGEEFYFAAQIHLGSEIFDQVKTLSAGGVAGPFNRDGGIGFVYVYKNQVPKALPYETVRLKVASDYANAAARRITHGEEQFLQKRSNILIASDLK